MKNVIILITAMVIAAALSGPGVALATTYGNPAPHISKGELSPGIALSDDREELYLDWGISDPGTLRLILGAVDLGGDDGTEFGVGYRHKSAKRAKAWRLQRYSRRRRAMRARRAQRYGRVYACL